MARNKYSARNMRQAEDNINQSNNPKLNRLNSILVPLGLLMIAGAMVMPFFMGPGNPLGWYRYVYALGALILLVMRIITPFRTKDLRLKRLVRLETWSAVFFCVAVVFMFYEPRQMRDWVAFTLAGAAIQIFTSLAIPARKRKLAVTELSFRNSKNNNPEE